MYSFGQISGRPALVGLNLQLTSGNSKANSIMLSSRGVLSSRIVPIGLFLAIAGMGFGGTPAPRLPLSFEVNQGQADPGVRFLSRGDAYTLLLTSDTAVFRLGSAPTVVRMKLDGANPAARISGAGMLPGKVNYFLGSDPKKWTSGASTYSKIQYRQVYEGIDLVYYGTNRQLEYDFVVAPGADAGQIALEFAGAGARLTADGSLQLTVEGAPLIFRKPSVYQMIDGKRETIAGSYRLTARRVQFELGKYDRTRALVIDPVLSYLTYLGGSGTDIAGNTTYSASGNPTQGMAVDSAGNAYVTGYTQSLDFRVQNAIQGKTTTLSYTGFVSKLNPAGTQLIYSTYFGGDVLQGNSTTRPHAIAVDGSGNAYLTGYTSSPFFPVTAGAYQTVCGTVFNNVTNCPNATSAFLTKLNPAGAIVYSTFLGHTNEAGVAVAVDSQGKAYIAGNSSDSCAANDPGNCFPTTPNAVLPGSAFNNTINPGNTQQGSAFIAVFDAAGANLLYSSLFGGTGTASGGNNHPTFASGVAVDASGNFYLAGTTLSNQLPVTKGAFQTTYYGNSDPNFGTSSRGFVAKFNPVSSGATLSYTTYLGGFDKTLVSYQDTVAGIAADAAGNAYVSGNASYDFPATPGANNSTPCPGAGSCMNRGFLAKLNPAGTALVWATFVGTGVSNPTLSQASTISPPRLDAQGNVYVSGNVVNNSEFLLVNPLQPANSFGGSYVTMFDPTGRSLAFSTVIYDPRANGAVFNSGVDVDAQGNIYTGGYTSQAGLPTTPGALQTANAGAQDVFLAKIDVTTPVVTPGGVVPLYSTISTVQAGEWISIYGSNFATTHTTWTPGTFPTSLAGVSVTIDGKAAYILDVGPTQIDVQVPDGVTPGIVQVAVTAANGSVAKSTVTIAPFAPSFSLLDAKHVAGIILRANGSGAYGGGAYDIIGPTGSSFGYATVAAKAGDTLELFGVGFGPTSPPVPAGASFIGAAPTSPPDAVTLKINNVSVSPFFAGLSGAGLYQLNVTIPPGLGAGDVPLQAFVGGAQTPAVVISLQ
jgi:uncharacterized protein (TIGR03437 family)